jgi:orotidine-5'-phosphate decarboxylase
MSCNYLSNKPIPHNQRLIIALDLATTDQAKDLVKQLGDSVNFYKIGMELFMTGEYFQLIDWLKLQNKNSLCRFKIF